MECFGECVEHITNALVDGRQVYILQQENAVVEKLLESIRDSLFHLFEKQKITWDEYVRTLSHLCTVERFNQELFEAGSNPIVVSMQWNFILSDHLDERGFIRL